MWLAKTKARAKDFLVALAAEQPASKSLYLRRAKDFTDVIALLAQHLGPEVAFAKAARLCFPQEVPKLWWKRHAEQLAMQRKW